ADADGLADNEIIISHQALLAAMRGDADRAQALLPALPDLLASDEPQSRALLSIINGFIAIARREPETTLRRALATLDHTDALGVTHEATRWAWPMATRAALELNDTAATLELLALLDGLQPGRLTPMLRA